MPALRSFEVRLATSRLRLRPMTEADWPTLLRWNQDPRVLLFWNDGDTTAWRLDALKRIYRELSKRAYMFIAELGGRPIAECWLQQLNLGEILDRFPGQKLFRIDLSIGEPDLWGQGFGTEIVGALVEFGFRSERAYALFACHVRDTNIGSRRVFSKNGFSNWMTAGNRPKTVDGSVRRHLILTRESWEHASGAAPRASRTSARTRTGG
jgi:RimJ/RimL family protein N-acetyltransferase